MKRSDWISGKDYYSWIQTKGYLCVKCDSKIMVRVTHRDHFYWKCETCMRREDRVGQPQDSVYPDWIYLPK